MTPAAASNSLELVRNWGLRVPIEEMERNAMQILARDLQVPDTDDPVSASWAARGRIEAQLRVEDWLIFGDRLHSTAMRASYHLVSEYRTMDVDQIHSWIRWLHEILRPALQRTLMLTREGIEQRLAKGGVRIDNPDVTRYLLREMNPRPPRDPNASRRTEPLPLVLTIPNADEPENPSVLLLSGKPPEDTLPLLRLLAF